MEKLDCHTLIVGGGLSGLACALTLEAAGVDWLLIEKDSALGGRVRTQKTESGFLLDHGFQVLNTAYPALHRLVDLSELNLGAFASGAEVFSGGKYHRIADPLRSPGEILNTLGSSIGSVQDKLSILRLIWFCRGPSNLDSVSHLSTEEFLSHFGFSEGIVSKFFRPFFGGVFLEEELLTSARKFVTQFAYFSRGQAALPARGMQALPDLLASRLPAERIKLSVAAERCERGTVRTENLSIQARHLALAGWHSQHLLLGINPPATHSAYTTYFSRSKGYEDGKTYLKLNGSRHGTIQTIAINSAAQPSYAPSHSDLMVVSTRQSVPESRLRQELSDWFGSQIEDWRHLRSDHIRQALPQEFRPLEHPSPRELEGLRVHLLGDHTETGSIQGALTSGRRAGAVISNEWTFYL